MFKIFCPHCEELNTVSIPKDKGFEACDYCDRGFEFYPNGNTKPTPLDHAVGDVTFPFTRCFSFGSASLKKSD